MGAHWIRSVTLFKFRKIDVKIHPTFLLVLIYAAFSWGVVDGGGLVGALFGLLATLLLFVGVLLHEMGHSFMSLKVGVRVRGITLHPLGGFAQLEKPPKRPSEDLRISIAGPLVNFALAGLLIVLRMRLMDQTVLSLEDLAQPIGEVSWSWLLGYLILVNVGLGLFNLTPAFPLDGGHILRALLALQLDYIKATRIAVYVGQGIAVLLGLSGLISGSYSDVLIALLIWIAAVGERNRVMPKIHSRKSKPGRRWGWLHKR